MGRNKKDLVRKRYFRDNSRQADLLNAYAKNREIRDEKEVPWRPLRKEDFEEKESELYTFVDTIKGVLPIVRIVDSSRIINYCGKRFCFFIENQEKVDYSMPNRIFLHEAICYKEQADLLRIDHKQRKDLLTIEEKFSGMKKEDKLMPAISLVLYYGVEPWDGAKEMKEILDEEGLPEEWKALVGHHPMNLIEIRDIDYLEDFQTDLHETFGFIKYQNDVDKLKHFVAKNQEKFEKLSEDAYDFITYQTGIRKLERLKRKYKTAEGDYDMCKAIDDLEKRSRREGERDNAIQNARMFFRNGATMELVASSILILNQEELEEIYQEVHVAG